jgi:hypothetical protein
MPSCVIARLFVVRRRNEGRSIDDRECFPEPFLVFLNGHLDDAFPAEFNGGADVGRTDLPRTESSQHSL